MKQEWCEHLKWTQSGTWFFELPTNHVSYGFTEEWQQCPICLAPRPLPPKKKSLAEAMCLAYRLPFEDNVGAARRLKLMLDSGEVDLEA